MPQNTKISKHFVLTFCVKSVKKKKIQIQLFPLPTMINMFIIARKPIWQKKKNPGKTIEAFPLRALIIYNLLLSIAQL